jgi:hypothetical protein
MRDVPALIKMAALLAKNKKMKLYTAAKKASRYTTGASTEAITRRLVKGFKRAVHKYFETRLALDPDFISIIVDDELIPSDSESFDALVWMVDDLQKSIEEINNLLAFTRNANSVSREEVYWPFKRELRLRDYSQSDIITLRRDTAYILKKISDLRDIGISTDAAVDAIGRVWISRNAKQLQKLILETKRYAQRVSRKQRSLKEVSAFDFEIDMILIKNSKFFDGYLDAFYNQSP